jgi:hypothetical protein
MTTHNHFQAVFGSGRGRPYAHADVLPRRVENDWVHRLFRHFAAAPTDYIRGLAKLSSTAYADDFRFGVRFDASRLAWERFRREAGLMIEELHRTVFSRLTALGSNGDCTGLVIDLGFCMVARDGLESGEIEIVRSFLRETDVSIDLRLGQRPLREW